MTSGATWTTTMVGARATNAVVEQTASRKAKGEGRPAHHVDDTMTRFTNPWPSFRLRSFSQFIAAMFAHILHGEKVPSDLSTLIPSRTPDWGAGQFPDQLKATWLGHACFLVELPTPKGASRGPRILFDPVLSHRCFPVQWVGPQRLLPTPCRAEDVPPVDVICISHNHYDHMDFPTLKTVYKLYQPHIFAPLGNAHHLRSIGIPDSHIHILDWWDACTVSLTLPRTHASSDDDRSPAAGADANGDGVQARFVVTCTPSQHTANRSIFDRWRTLWSSWAVEEVLQPSSTSTAGDTVAEGGRAPRKVYFAGDTGYRTVDNGEDEDTVPRCPAFAEIGEVLGPFDLALLPIGAYAPRWMWSFVHASPSDSVQIFKDIRARKALAMHWGTWELTMEPIMEPPKLLKKECAKAGLEEGTFDICGLGETRTF
ncbi:N-acyl-phosphatidylethanolamine-hydrolyzing phospholipase D [Trametes punicea]|nr:N-acyl-phosphatidylethanolamine-hydrolyzing phospholipase D [Trametes punicea]